MRNQCPQLTHINFALCQVNGVVHNDLVEYKRNINVDVYCRIFNGVIENLFRKCPPIVKGKCVILQHDKTSWE